MAFAGVQAAPPPPRTTARSTKTGNAPRVNPKHNAREEALNGVGQLLSFGLMLGGQHADAGAISRHWPNVAAEATNVADNDPKMAKALDYLLEVGPYGNLIVAALPLVAQLMVNHGMAKPESMAGAGVVHPETLAADVKATIARQAAEAVRAQREAEEELARLRMESEQSSNGHQARHATSGEWFEPAGQ